MLRNITCIQCSLSTPFPQSVYLNVNIGRCNASLVWEVRLECTNFGSINHNTNYNQIYGNLTQELAHRCKSSPETRTLHHSFHQSKHKCSTQARLVKQELHRLQHNGRLEARNHQRQNFNKTGRVFSKQKRWFFLSCGLKLCEEEDITGSFDDRKMKSLPHEHIEG